MTLSIDKEFRELIPPLTTEEFSQLEQNILAEGCRDAIVTWNNIIIDGHNRYEICTNHNLEFSTVELNLSDRPSVVKWIIDNQLGRRNITTEQRTYLLGLRYRQEKKPSIGREGRTFGVDIMSTPKTAEEIAIQHNVSGKTVQRAEKFADALDRIETIAPEVKQEILQGRAEVTKNEVIELATAPAEKFEAKVEEIRKPHVSNNSGNNEWYTPPEYIEIARIVMGSIDTDPASSEIANKTVMAETYHTENDNGLEKDWHGNVWMNPPYAQPLITQFSEKLVNQIKAGNVKQAMVLVNNATETGWFNTMAEHANAIWFVKGRIKFIDQYGYPGGAPLQGQCVLYFGHNYDKFEAACNGLVCRCNYVRKR